MIKKYELSILLTLFLIIPNVICANGPIEADQGIFYKTIIAGNGTKATLGMIATIHFIMWQDHNGEKGKKLLDSREEGRPVSFKIGKKGIGEGLDIGVNGMKVGETRRMYIPSHLNPQKSSGKFPAKANLIFEVELLKVQ